MSIDANEIEIHYFLPEGKHSMDAFILAKAEAEFISIIKEISELLQIDDFKLKTEALTEGGIRQKLLAFGKNSILITALTALTIETIVSYIPHDTELKELQKEESRLHIQLLKKKLGITEENSKELEQLSEKKTILRKKSNYYQSLQYEGNIESVSFTLLSNGVATKNTYNVKRESFSHYILPSKDPLTELDENAVIQIISPVLTGENLSWKGNYQGNRIGFHIKDSAFTSQVSCNQYQFHNGTSIRSVLEIKKPNQDTLSLDTITYKVLTVIEVLNETGNTITESGKKHITKKQHNKAQIELFDN